MEKLATRWVLGAFSLLWSGAAAADALPYEGYKPPPCPPGSDWKSGGAGHRYCAPIACSATPCSEGATCQSVELCLQPRNVAVGKVDEVVAREGAGCPAAAHPSTERVCVASSPAPSPQRPSSGCGCQQAPAPGGAALALAVAAALAAARRARFARRSGAGGRRAGRAGPAAVRQAQPQPLPAPKP